MLKSALLLNLTCSVLLAITQANLDATPLTLVDQRAFAQSGQLRVSTVPNSSSYGGLVLLFAIGNAIFSFDRLMFLIDTGKPKTKKEIEPETQEESDPEIQKDVGETDAETQEESDQEVLDSTQAKQNQNRLFDLVWNHRKRHLLIPAETGAGKTSFLLGLIQDFYNRSDSVEFFGSTAKPSPWLGLEDQTAGDKHPRIINLDVTRPYTLETLIDRLRWIQQIMQKRQIQRAEAEANNQPYNPSRIIIVLDEWNTTRAIAKRYDKQLQKALNEAKAAKESTDGLQAPYAEEELISLVESFLLMGREDEIAIWLFGQDHQVQNAGINTGYRKFFGIVVPFRLGATQALEDALIGKSAVLPTAIGRQLLVMGNDALEEQPKAQFVYSNLNGHEIVVCPYLPNIKREKLTQNGTESTTAKQQTELQTTADPW